MNLVALFRCTDSELGGDSVHSRSLTRNMARISLVVLLIAILTGCAARSRAQSLLPSVNIPVECATSIRFVNCDLSFSPPRCRATTVAYRKGCEQVMAAK
jgi:hypothetical protein